MKNHLRNFGMFALSFAFIALACSDNATDNNLTEGEPNDPSFLAAQDISDGFVDSLFITTGTAFGFIDFDGTAPMNAPADTFLVVFDSSSCWWSLNWSIDTTIIFSDSVKFQDANGCQQFPDSLTTTEIEYRAYLDINIVSDSGSITATASNNLALAGIQEDTTIINATTAMEADYNHPIYQLAYNYSGTLNDIGFLTSELREENEPKPLSGTLTLALTIFGTSPDGSGGVNWSVTITFNPNGYHGRAESGGNFWEWDVSYIA